MALVNITGELSTITGDPLSGAVAIFRVLGTPAIIGSKGYSSEPVVVKTDENGEFTIGLEEGLQIEVSIPSILFKRTIEVPSVDTPLFDIP